ncbi:unnamed protein product [Ilex paraguariensis]|uniref:Phytocyanin domain-containing protein n=1 Tax=Ilex paraguariensis TaxID=185542 RepID=A0ABC8S1Q4_9AQUA
MGEVYRVGDSTGWTNIGHVDYKTWSANKNFHVGDSILFQYNNQFHNVVRVTHKNFNACNATTPYANFTTGNDLFTIKKTGHFYFICSLPGHCQEGQKVDIRVVTGQTPTPAPAPSDPSPLPSPPPSPAPSPLAGNVPGPRNSGLALPLTKGLLVSKLGLSLVVLAFCGFAY